MLKLAHSINKTVINRCTDIVSCYV